MLGGTPTRSVKRVLKVPSEENPTAKHTSVTDMSPRRNSVMARSIRRVMRGEHDEHRTFGQGTGAPQGTHRRVAAGEARRQRLDEGRGGQGGAAGQDRGDVPAGPRAR